MKLKEKIEKLIVEAVLELNKDIKKSELHSPNKETKLYGGNATLDSLSLVGLIVMWRKEYLMNLIWILS